MTYKRPNNRRRHLTIQATQSLQSIMMKLFTYHRSNAAHRVRLALSIKGLKYEARFMELNHADMHSEEIQALHPRGTIPALVDGDIVLSQSIAILLYLEEKYPERPLLPEDFQARARVREIALTLATDIHPLNTYNLFHYLRDEMGVDYDKRKQWFEHHMHHGLSIVETMLADNPATGAYCHGDKPTMADTCLIPQVYAAREKGIDLTEYPTIRGIYQYAMSQAAFQAAAPNTQPDSDASQQRLD